MSDLLRPETTHDLAGDAATLLGVLREAPPLTHCITNAVVTGFTANVLLALGAAPAMVDIVDEAGMFAGIASGVLINLGTPTPEQRAATLEAVAGAVASGTPWVLEVNPDPDLSSDAGLARMGRAYGWDYPTLVLQVVEEALERGRVALADGALSGRITS